MSARRTLVEGIASPEKTREAEAFVFGNARPAEQEAPRTARPAGSGKVNRVPFSTKMRTDIFSALKRASLERELEGITPYNMQDLVEDVLEPWLRSNGFLK
jgi:hypothetical protein